MISGLTVLSSVLTRYVDALDSASTYLFLRLMVDLYSLSVLLLSLVGNFIPSDKSLNNCRSINRSICVIRIFAIVLQIAANFILVEADLQHFRQHPGPGLHADMEECAAVHGEN